MDKKILTEAHLRATAKYNAKAYEQLMLRVKRGRKDEIVNHAKLYDESINAFLLRAVDEAIARDLKNKKDSPKDETPKCKKLKLKRPKQ